MLWTFFEILEETKQEETEKTELARDLCSVSSSSPVQLWLNKRTHFRIEILDRQIPPSDVFVGIQQGRIDIHVITGVGCYGFVERRHRRSTAGMSVVMPTSGQNPFRSVEARRRQWLMLN